jgi:hypothetical protein
MFLDPHPSEQTRARPSFKLCALSGPTVVLMHVQLLRDVSRRLLLADGVM